MACGTAFAEESIDVPQVEGEWWQIVPNAPDVGQWSTGQENACDFAIVRSADAKWHCIACIRGTSHYEQRLFFRWEADDLTDTDWKPCGILDVPRGKRGKPMEFTSVQAPHPFVHDGKYYLLYNSAKARCIISDDGRQWRPHVNTDGSQELFAMGRDVCVFHDSDNGRWIADYCGTCSIVRCEISNPGSRLRAYCTSLRNRMASWAWGTVQFRNSRINSNPHIA